MPRRIQGLCIAPAQLCSPRGSNEISAIRRLIRSRRPFMRRAPEHRAPQRVPHADARRGGDGGAGRDHPSRAPITGTEGESRRGGSMNDGAKPKGVDLRSVRIEAVTPHAPEHRLRISAISLSSNSAASSFHMDHDRGRGSGRSRGMMLLPLSLTSARFRNRMKLGQLEG